MTAQTLRPATAPASSSGAAADGDSAKGVRVLVFLRDRGIIVLWLLLVVIFAFWASPYFFTLGNAALIANAAALTAVFAAAVGFGVLSGALDLSIPGSATMAAVVGGVVIKSGAPAWLGIIAALAVGIVVGTVNGILVLRGLNPLVVTIASLTVLGGLAAGRRGRRTGHRHHASSPGWAARRTSASRRPSTWSPSCTSSAGCSSPRPARASGCSESVATSTRFDAWASTPTATASSASYCRASAPRSAGSSSWRRRRRRHRTRASTCCSPPSRPSPSRACRSPAAAAAFPASSSVRSIIATIASALIIRGIQPYWATIATGVLLVAALGFERVMSRAVANRLAPPPRRDARRRIHHRDPGTGGLR